MVEVYSLHSEEAIHVAEQVRADEEDFHVEEQVQVDEENFHVEEQVQVLEPPVQLPAPGA